MNHWIIVPVLLPAVLASVMVMSMRHELALQRVVSVAGAVVLLAVTLGLTVQASSGAIQVYELGNWPAPFGIVLVLDRLSALMIVLTAVLALMVLLYAIGTGWDSRGKHFHPLMHFQLMGIFGAFLTGDAFNLFVFFEVLLIASYGLMIHAGGRMRLRAGLQYVVYNLLGSTLFLFALGTLYAVTGTLNMADLAVRIAEIPAADAGLVRIGAILLLLVFAVKAALLPLHFWLPETYSRAPAPVAALFAIMTKVGAYAILRVYTLIFGPDLPATAALVAPAIMVAALITLAVGMIGILGAREIGRLAAFAAIGSMGTLLIAVAGFTPASTTAALYYLVHSTIGGALLFFTVDLVREHRGAWAGALRPGPRMARHGIIAALFFGAAIATAGLPPLSGFVGKLLILDALRDAPQAGVIWTVILATSLLALLGFAQAGSAVFWKPLAEGAPPPAATENTTTASGAALAHDHPAPALAFAVVFAALFAVAALAVLAGPLTDYLAAITAQLYLPGEYIDAVMAGR
jgi:multicomponent K+:H+ antiporter subunit D